MVAENTKPPPVGCTLDIKTAYDLTKVTSTFKLTMDSIISSMVITMFVDYIRTYEDPEATFLTLMSAWKTSILESKQFEIQRLSGNDDTLNDMLVSSEILSNDDYIQYEEEVDEVFTDVVNAVIRQLRGEMDDTE